MRPSSDRWGTKPYTLPANTPFYVFRIDTDMGPSPWYLVNPEPEGLDDGWINSSALLRGTVRRR